MKDHGASTDEAEAFQARLAKLHHAPLLDAPVADGSPLTLDALSGTRARGPAAIARLLAYLKGLPFDTKGAQAVLTARGPELSWTELHLFASDLVTLAEAEVGMPEHSRRVSHIALRYGVALGLGIRELGLLYWGGALHDIGKLTIDQDVLRKPGPLSACEWRLIQEHPLWGHEILMQVFGTEQVAQIALTHHEHWDGSGYPHGLAGEAIPLFGRIVAVADTFDALTTPRAYRQLMRKAAAVRIIADEAGRQFDPELVQRLLDGGVLHQSHPDAENLDVG